MDTQYYSLVLIPFLIFIARVTDVTIGTMRIIFVSRGLRFIAASAGFLEILLWLFAISQIMANLNNWINYIAYAGGFAAGNYLGITMERHLAMGFLVVRIITQRNGTTLEEKLRDSNFIVTAVDAQGGKGPVKILFTVVRRKSLPRVVDLIKANNPNAYYTIEDLRSVSSPGPYPLGGNRLSYFPSLRKGK